MSRLGVRLVRCYGKFWVEIGVRLISVRVVGLEKRLR